MSYSYPTSTGYTVPTVETLTISSYPYTPTMNHEQAQPTTTSVDVTTITQTGDPFLGTGNHNLWNDMAHGSKIAVVIAMIIGVTAIVIFSIWFCCGGRAKWAKHSPARMAGVDNGVIPLHTIHNIGADERAVGGGGDAPPPRYAEVVPEDHQRLAGGIAHVRPNEEEEDGVISDGKTPLSEIPFEDVVLDQGSSSSASSPSQDFAAAHHLRGGDTTGHTNT